MISPALPREGASADSPACHGPNELSSRPSSCATTSFVVSPGRRGIALQALFVTNPSRVRALATALKRSVSGGSATLRKRRFGPTTGSSGAARSPSGRGRPTSDATAVQRPRSMFTPRARAICGWRSDATDTVRTRRFLRATRRGPERWRGPNGSYPFHPEIRSEPTASCERIIVCESSVAAAERPEEYVARYLTRLATREGCYRFVCRSWPQRAFEASRGGRSEVN